MATRTPTARDRRVRTRAGPGTRRAGYVAAAVVNAAMLFAVNRWPGWEALPFLTRDTAMVVGWVNASILATLVANLVYTAYDPRWFKALGDVATTGVGLLALLRIWEVFPFSFGESRIDWELVTQVLLLVGIVGSVIGILAALASFVKALTGSPMSHGT